MLRNIISFHSAALKAVETGTSKSGIDGGSASNLSWSKIREVSTDLMYRLTSMKFEDPSQGSWTEMKLQKLNKDIEEHFRNLSE